MKKIDYYFTQEGSQKVFNLLFVVQLICVALLMFDLNNVTKMIVIGLMVIFSILYLAYKLYYAYLMKNKGTQK